MTAERMVADRYRLVRRAGEGGMGVVWRARDEALHREVALKELKLDGLDEAARAAASERFLLEAQAAAGLHHPAIVSVYDILEEDGSPWIVMQLIEGRSLHELVVENGRLPLDEVVRIGLALTGALDTAHRQGVIHRDVTPRNVLSAADGKVILGDFGIAAIAGVPGRTGSGAILGAPGYIPPERFNGERAGPQSDLWSLGATLFYAVEGRAPFDDVAPEERIAAVRNRDPARPSHAGPLAPVLLHLLAREPADRPATAAVLQDQLNVVQSLLTDGASLDGAAVEEMVEKTLEQRNEATVVGPRSVTLSTEQAPEPYVASRLTRRLLFLGLGLLMLAAGLSILLSNPDNFPYPDGWIAERGGRGDLTSEEISEIQRLVLTNVVPGSGAGVVGLLLAAVQSVRLTTGLRLTVDRAGIRLDRGLIIRSRSVVALRWPEIVDALVVDKDDAKSVAAPMLVVRTIRPSNAAGYRPGAPWAAYDKHLDAYRICFTREVAAKPRQLQSALDEHIKAWRETVEERVDLILNDVGDRKLKVFQELRILTGIDTNELKEMAEVLPTPVLIGVDLNYAQEVKETLENVGATVEIN